MKTCSCCRVELPFVMFNSCRGGRGGVQAVCRPCASTQQKNYREANKEKLKAYRAVFAAKNKEMIATRKAAWQYNNPEYVTARNAKRKAIKISATPSWSDLDAIQAFYEDARTLETIFGWKFHVDHIIPLNHPLVSGLHVPANLQILNAKENLSKSNTFNTQDH